MAGSSLKIETVFWQWPERGGKGTNLIVPNLLGLGSYTGLWVVIDPKDENVAITARYQLERGKQVVILNPLDIPTDTSSIHFVDDTHMIAKMLVPVEKGDKNGSLPIRPTLSSRGLSCRSSPLRKVMTGR